jgi:PBP1b-binding outer membrane lipoprotein LpoB
MSPRKAYVVLAALIAAGCASNSQVDDSVASAAPTIAATSSSAATGSTSVVPDAVIDANDLVASTPARPVCREMLRPNSNVQTRYCMSAEDWKTYDRAEARRAGELVRTWQGGDYR